MISHNVSFSGEFEGQRLEGGEGGSQYFRNRAQPDEDDLWTKNVTI